ncbi:leucyl/phenylalanyl-tRNA--protein transferase [Profundibacterium mesophilum]|uniref:Leucyl/phenylalanyl-tRNA--protein transferase n=1 Tax=Profundibacterium mesophilum KAUST100406-0324 TaxID=1037889 RepID=A0A921NUG6_9RHOB|nr:leucyl/phenylalanyl-tRNA--protein transferase [Profundibacterium mesophilum]KAF0674994.1 Leucylphenylalanyl-tRNA--protein transferase [Profundibacterium mesophilum KAUST100406-0324]
MGGSSALTPELLLNGYAQGIFPMSESRDDPEIFWVDPRLRGIIPLDGFHVSRSLRRRLTGLPFSITVNQDFDGVVSGCADRSETWISDTIFALYRALHLARYAHSLEVWDGHRLVGGVYGVALGGAFFGESMFSRKTDASKIALFYLVDRLKSGGFTLFDTQFTTPHLLSLGAVEIPRRTYHARLERALRREADFMAAPPMPPVDQILQRMTQRS